ncbi:hypothetical protein IWZ03DRAFT_103478 [Phyllosticta citriasiana]|uniref:Uncharacterized protein n=1 Tax=Phyllosticta citriasiana TaxID=595635 RepID=A0ABR1KUL8_9PEZI
MCAHGRSFLYLVKAQYSGRGHCFYGVSPFFFLGSDLAEGLGFLSYLYRGENFRRCHSGPLGSGYLNEAICCLSESPRYKEEKALGALVTTLLLFFSGFRVLLWFWYFHLILVPLLFSVSLRSTSLGESGCCGFRTRCCKL